MSAEQKPGKLAEWQALADSTLLSDSLREACAEIERLHKSVRNQCADNLCWMDDPEKGKTLPAAEFLESCRRYHAQITVERGGIPPDARGMTIAQLEAEIERLHAEYRELSLTAERAYSTIAAVCSAVQKHQPAGSPPPGGLEVLAVWVLDSMQAEIERLSGDQEVATMKARVLDKFADYCTSRNEHIEQLGRERALRRELMEALEPFAAWNNYHGEADAWWAKSKAPLCLNMQRIAVKDDVTVQDLIRAAAALAMARELDAKQDTEAR